MISPTESLAYSIQANRRAYAVLLGSGVSKSAGIMTGWDITLDLVRQLAASRGEPRLEDPKAWYWKQFGKSPDYSDLLDQLTRTPQERQGLLQTYIEPTPEEREAGLKVPTRAHNAVAKLASSGFIKLILTTNFDRLIESALREHGVEPITLTTTDDIRSAQTFDLMDCCVVKLHGDYLEGDIRNTVEELQTYEPELIELLDRIFRDYGLIICGWSADWDVALRRAMTRGEARRYATYWVDIAEPGDAAKKIITNRPGELIRSDADTFFEDLQQKVEVLTAYRAPHPLTVATALRRLKDYLPDRTNRIRLRGLVDEAIGQVLESTDTDLSQMRATLEYPGHERAGQLVEAYQNLCAVLQQMGQSRDCTRSLGTTMSGGTP